jgi:hypothetical protein
MPFSNRNSLPTTLFRTFAGCLADFCHLFVIFEFQCADFVSFHQAVRFELLSTRNEASDLGEGIPVAAMR